MRRSSRSFFRLARTRRCRFGDVVNYIADAIDYHNIEYDHTKADGQYKKTASNAKLRKYLPDYKFTPMKQGIKETVDWFVKNYDSARK